MGFRRLRDQYFRRVLISAAGHVHAVDCPIAKLDELYTATSVGTPLGSGRIGLNEQSVVVRLKQTVAVSEGRPTVLCLVPQTCKRRRLLRGRAC